LNPFLPDYTTFAATFSFSLLKSSQVKPAHRQEKRELLWNKGSFSRSKGDIFLAFSKRGVPGMGVQATIHGAKMGVKLGDTF
jgi:hypothetical protein